MDRFELIKSEEYRRFVKSAPMTSWIFHYNLTVLQIGSIFHDRNWVQLLGHRNLLPHGPHLVRYVTVPFYKFVRGPFITNINTIDKTHRALDASSGSMDDILRSKHESASPNHNIRECISERKIVCCNNACSYATPNKSFVYNCGFCTPTKTSKPYDCLCDCLIFQYCMIWRGAYIRDECGNYTVNDTAYSCYAARVVAFRLHDWLDRLHIGSIFFGAIVITPLLANVLAAMGFAPAIDNSTKRPDGACPALRCYRCYTAIRLKDIVPIATPDQTPYHEAIVVLREYDGANVDELYLLDRLLRSLNTLHGRANCYCPHVLMPFDEATVMSEHCDILQQRYRPLVMYATRFTIPGDHPIKRWGMVKDDEDELFGRNTEHVVCKKYVCPCDEDAMYILANLFTLGFVKLTNASVADDLYYDRAVSAYRNIFGVIELTRRSKCGVKRVLSALDEADDRTKRAAKRPRSKVLDSKENAVMDSEMTAITPGTHVGETQTPRWRRSNAEENSNERETNRRERLILALCDKMNVRTSELTTSCAEPETAPSFELEINAKSKSASDSELETASGPDMERNTSARSIKALWRKLINELNANERKSNRLAREKRERHFSALCDKMNRESESTTESGMELETTAELETKATSTTSGFGSETTAITSGICAEETDTLWWRLINEEEEIIEIPPDTHVGETEIPWWRLIVEEDMLERSIDRSIDREILEKRKSLFNSHYRNKLRNSGLNIICAIINTE